MNTLSLFAHETLGVSDHMSNVAAAATTATPSPEFIFQIILIIFIFTAISYVIGALLLGRIFKKAGISPAIAWIPVYNSWKTFEIGGQKGYWAVLAFIPIAQYVSIVFMYIAYYNISLKLGKSGSFVLWAIFLPIVWIIWLATDASKWNNALGTPSLAVEHTTSAPTATPPVAPTATPIV